ncbi:MAG: tetratricopeptide repeat protein [Polyangiaceae bacterium]
MRLALLVDPSAPPTAVEDLVARPGTKLVVLPPAERLVQAIARAMRAYGVGADAVLVVQAAGEGVVEGSAWEGAFSGAAIATDDDAVIEARIAEASQALDEGRLDDAHEAYAYCDALLADEPGPRHAEVLVCLAQIADARGDREEAIRRLDYALAVFPTHRSALEMRLVLARRLGHPAAAAVMAKKLLAFAEGDDQRIALLNQAADDGLHVAVDMMNAALRIRPGDALLLERLRAVHEAKSDWPKAVDVAVTVAEQMLDPQARARAFVEAAEMSASRAKNVGRAVALYEAAIADDPEVPGAFDAIEKVLLDDGDYEGARRAYERQLERLAGRGAVEAALLDKLGQVLEDKLGDHRGAIQAFDRLAVLRPDDVDARVRLARLLETTGEDALALLCLEVAAQHTPARPEVFRAIARIGTRAGDADRAYCASSVLVHLGEADLDEQLTYQQFAPEVPVRPVQALDDAAWAVLIPADVDAVASTLFAAIGPAAIAARLEHLRVKKQLPRLDPDEKHDVERTTVSAVRMVGWVSKLLAVPCPDVYVSAHGVPGGVGVLPAIDPSLVLGPSILSGRPVNELPFLFGRELAYQHLTSRVLPFYPTLDELRSLVTAALALVLGRGAHLPPDVDRTARDLALRLDPPSRAALESAVQRVTDRDGPLDLLSWLRAVERASCRAGLLACGDLMIASRVLSLDRHAVGGMSAAERVRDLVPFSVSEAYGGLRRTLGIAARTSQLG